MIRVRVKHKYGCFRIQKIFTYGVTVDHNHLAQNDVEQVVVLKKSVHIFSSVCLLVFVIFIHDKPFASTAIVWTSLISLRYIQLLVYLTYAFLHLCNNILSVVIRMFK